MCSAMSSSASIGTTTITCCMLFSMSRAACLGPTSICCSGCHWCHSSRSEEHTSELQSRLHLVCRLLLEKKKIVASLPLIKERILVIILLLHFLSLMLGSVLVLMLPLLVWLTPDLRIKKSLLKCNWTIRKRLPRCKMRLKKRFFFFLRRRHPPISTLFPIPTLFR